MPGGYEGYHGEYSSDGYVPGPGETIIADRRMDEPATGIEQRYAEASSNALQSFDSPSDELAVGNSNELATSSNVANNYDGTGWLMPVVTDRSDMPRYVLTDSKGNVKQFVTPQPGLNLQRYLRKKIAIYGQERYMQDMKRPHLTAERIISLDSKTR